MSNLNTVSLSDFTDLVSKTFLKGPELVAEVARQLFIVENMDANTGDSRKYTEIDTETYASLKREGQDASIASVQQGYSVTMYAKRVAKEITITWEMRRYNKYPEVTGQLVSLASFVPQRMELDLTHRLTFALSTSYTDMDGATITTTVGDGLALVSASHTLRGTSTTFSNVITGNPVFSKGGLEVAESQANTQILSQFGERRVMNFNTIITSDDPNTVNTVKEYLNSTADVTGNNSGVVNVYKGKYKHVILPYLATTANGAYDSTKAKYWALAATGQGVMGWQAYLGIWEAANLKAPSAGNNGEDVHNDNWTYGTRGSYGIVTVSPRGLLLSTGLGS